MDLIVMQADGKGLFPNRARLELLLAAVRDPTLAEPSTRFVNRILALPQEAISAVQPDADDQELSDAQSDVVMTLIAGAFTRFAAGDRTLAQAGHLERMLRAAVAGVTVAFRD